MRAGPIHAHKPQQGGAFIKDRDTDRCTRRDRFGFALAANFGCISAVEGRFYTHSEPFSRLSALKRHAAARGHMVSLFSIQLVLAASDPPANPNERGGQIGKE